MRIRDVDVPEPLVEAALAGKLVLFVGAGASIDPPSNLPTFRGLTKAIATESAFEFADADLNTPDSLLGRMELSQVDVHQRVHAHIARPGSAPNLLHEAIVDLASSCGSPRVVTTNYDRHLSTVAETRSLGWSEYAAPALPMGDDFAGLVYLHGTLNQVPRHLISTDADFGRAYLLDAWAARFLERMFPKFTVLFIGYSHTDVVMSYLGRSLGPGSTRYVFTDDPLASKWQQLNIQPVGYEVSGASHAALTEAIAQWARLLSMGLLDHRQQIAQYVSAPPSRVPEEQSYLESVLEHEQRVTLFTELAHGEEWLRWAASLPHCRPLFDPNSIPTATTWTLARWFASQCLEDESMSRVGLRIVSDARGRLSAPLWDALGQRMSSVKPRPTWAQPWLALMVENAPKDRGPWLDYTLAASELPQDRDIAMLLFDYLTEPHLEPRLSFGLDETPRFDVELRAEEFWLRDAWTKVLQPNLVEVAHALVAIADRHLRRASQLMMTTGSARPGWDPTSAGRSSIAPHEQDRYGNKVGILIDAARDALNLLLATDVPAATGILKSWATSNVPLLTRLAIHAVARDSATAGSEKLAWLVDDAWLFDPQLKHEVFELMESGLPSADPATVDRLVALAEAGSPNATDDDTKDYESFNALTWIARYSTAPSAASALARAQAKHPDFGIREHPDFNMWFGGVRSGYSQPMPVDEFHDLLQNNRAAALARLGELKRARFALDEPTWEDGISLVRQVVQEHPGDGLILLGPTNDLDGQLIGAIISGWSPAKLDDATAEKALERLLALDVSGWAHDLAWMLASHSGNENRTEWHRFDAARDLARAIGRSDKPGPILEGDLNWFEKAINARGGMLAEFWMQVISFDWKSDESGWAGVPQGIREAIDELRSGDTEQAHLAEVILSSQLHFLFAADREWCETTVVPLLSCEYPARARRAWDGFLSSGRWSDELLEAGLLERYLEAVVHFSDFSDEIGRQLAVHLASVALYSEIEPSRWLRRFTASASVQLRVDWINEVAWSLDRLDADVLRRHWTRWMEGYWKERLDSIPLELAYEEASALAGWVAKLHDNIDEAVDLAVSARAGISEHGRVLHELNENAARAPAAYARLIAHLLAHTLPPFWECHYLKEIVAAISQGADEGFIREIREHALRLNCPGAADW